MRGSPPIAVLLACTAVAVGSVAAGCGGGDEEATTSATEEAPSATEDANASSGGAPESSDEISIADFKYDPEAVTVDAGTEVVWTNSDDAAHTATADDGSFDTGTLNLDDSGRATFDQPGTYSYYCRFHAFMKATVEVQ